MVQNQSQDEHSGGIWLDLIRWAVIAGSSVLVLVAAYWRYVLHVTPEISIVMPGGLLFGICMMFAMMERWAPIGQHDRKSSNMCLIAAAAGALAAALMTPGITQYISFAAVAVSLFYLIKDNVPNWRTPTCFA